MNERTLHVLEYDKIIALLMEEAATSVGRIKASALEPATNFESVDKFQAETDEAMHVLRLNKTVPFSHIVDITASLKRCEIGSPLDANECLEIAQLLYSGRQVKQFIEKLEESLPLLKAIAEAIFPFRELEKMITLKIDEHGEVMDDASSTLKNIRQSTRTYERQIRERLQQLSKSKSKMLTDSIVTIRNDRYVLPVKHEYRSAFGGIVHDQSSSGQTLFMEPRSIIDINNRLQQAIVKEKQEIDIILQKITSEIAEHTESLAINLERIAEMDFIFARAHLAVKMRASRPNMNKNGIIDIKQARHPLIDSDEVVSNDLLLGESYQAMVITGPNTGGKTVTLKTIGLCTLMAQSGLQIPALDGAKLAFFEKVYADIGDEQSIEQNLSTFSSHMTNIQDIMEKIDEHSLVLFDELGAGTDPQEGAALAMALLDDVIDRQARVVATTHYPELKAYGYNRNAVMNASVEFDVESLRPTYRLLMGIPGRSNAFEISERLGLRESILNRAKSYVGIDTKNVENMIMELENTKKAIDNELALVHGFLEEAEELKKDLQKAWNEFEQERFTLLAKAEDKADKALKKAREEAEAIVQEVRNMRDQTHFKEHEWIEAKKMIEEAKPQLTQETQYEFESNEQIEFEIGDEIKHKTLGQQGYIIEKKNQNEFVIQVGMMKVTAKRKDLQFIGKSKKSEQAESVSHMIRNASSNHVKPELDLRGERYEDAIVKLEQYIDAALLQGYPSVTIIHGKGTGALRKGVEAFLRQQRHVKHYRLGHHNEGGSGVTVIEFK